MRTLLIFLFVSIFFPSIAQDLDKTISIIVEGEGRSKIESHKKALNKAIDQVYQSNKSESLGAQSQAIKSYFILEEKELPNGQWRSVINAEVSLVNYSRITDSKGNEVRIRGGLYALIIRQQIQNTEKEVELISQLVKELHVKMQSSFDYSITSSTPRPIGDSPLTNTTESLFEIPLTITVNTNSNIDLCARMFNNLVKSISLRDSELTQFKEFSIPYFSLKYVINGIVYTAQFRSRESVDKLIYWANNWNYYTQHFNVYVKGQTTPIELKKLVNTPKDKSGSDFIVDQPLTMGKRLPNKNKSQKEIYQKKNIQGFTESGNPDENNIENFKKHLLIYKKEDQIVIDFPGSNRVVTKYYVENKYTLSQLQEVEGYRIEPSKKELETKETSSSSDNQKGWNFDTNVLRGIDNGGETGEITFFIRVNEKGNVTEIRIDRISVKLSLAERYKKLIKNSKFYYNGEDIPKGASGFKTIKIIPTN